MEQVAVVTDSVACLPKALAEKYGISIVPIDMVFNGQAHRNGFDDDPAEFYRLLESSKTLPTTASPSPGSYLQAYTEASSRAKNIVCVTISSKVSATHDAAVAARELAKEKLSGVTIEVVDSQAAAMAEGFVALAAARAAASGSDLSEVAAVARKVASNVYLLGVVDTLRLLVKGGRVPLAAAWATSLLQIKPILQIHNGEVTLAARVRTKSRAYKKLLELMKQSCDSKPVYVSVVHANALHEAELLKEQVASQFKCQELYITEFPLVMAAHTGPGLVGLSYYCES
jgi:DegV family protein with EDD domain